MWFFLLGCTGSVHTMPLWQLNQVLAHYKQTQIAVAIRKNKKVLLRERKRHTARRVAIAIFCYSGGGGSLDKKFIPSLNMYQAKSGVKNFSLYWGGGLYKNFFPSLNMYQAKFGVKNFSLYWGGGLDKIFFSPVWTCIKPNLVSNIFPFIETGDPPSPENLRPGIPPPENLRPGTPPRKIWDLGPPLPWHPWLDQVPPPPYLDLGPPPPSRCGLTHKVKI